ncbi:MAG: hypothetical protein M3Y05_17500, partial [Gemmatimonadota bacterium]|nr:hypothetical protein [Gemmatimonadota bacterium]
MIDSVPELVRRTLRGKRAVLAVSGGRDSMALLHAAHVRARESIACIACFDHGTGAHATESIALVRRTAAAMGLDFVTERAPV